MLSVPIEEEEQAESSTQIFTEGEFVEDKKFIPIRIASTSSYQSVNELGKQLLSASREGDADKIRWLFSEGATFTADWLGTSPLHLAAQNNHLDVCELLLRGGMSRDARTKVDKTPLHMAAYEGHDLIVQCLIKHGADVNALDILKMTPLHWAAQNGHMDVVQTLLEAGCITDLHNKFGLTASAIAASIDRQDIVEIIEASFLQRLSRVTDILSNGNAEEEVMEEEFITGDDPSGMVTVGDIQMPIETVLLDDIETPLDEEATINEIGTTDEEGQSEMDHVFQKMETEEVHAAYNDSLKLLQEQRITMLPADNNILATAMQTGHSMVLTDAGRDLLNSINQNSRTLTVQSDSNEPEVKPPERRKIVTLTLDEFLSLNNNTNFKKPIAIGNHINRKIAPKSIKRVVMKKNKLMPLNQQLKNMSTFKLQGHDPASDMELVMKQLIEARKTIEDYKRKLLAKDLELEECKKKMKKKDEELQKYKNQVKLYIQG